MTADPDQFAKTRAAVALLRLRRFDTSTAVGRSSERYRRIALSSFAAAAARVVTIASGLVIVPLALSHLGMEQYGLFVTITSLAALLAWSDLGIGNGVLSAVSAASARGDPLAERQIISSAVALLLGLAILMAVSLAALYFAIPWPRLFNTSSPEAATQAGPAVAVFAACFLVGLPLGIAQRAQLGYQEGFVASLWTGVGSVLAIAALVLAIDLDATLPWLIAAVAGGATAGLALNAVTFFVFQRPWLRPAPSFVRLSVIWSLLQTGGLFLMLQIAMAVAFESDAIVLAQILGAEAVTLFAVPFKLFMIAPILLSFLLLPFWPAYTEAVSRGELAWAQLALRRTLVVAAAVSVPLSATLILFGVQFVHLWVGDSVTPPLSLRLALGLWAIAVSFGGCFAMFLNGVGAMRFQAICAGGMMVVNLALSIALTVAFGESGVIWASFIAQTALVLVPAALYAQRYFRQWEPATGIVSA
jgi:O-antigen/teichoic acid export membrane protein